MSSGNSEASLDRIANFLGSVRKKGGKLWSENGQLHYKAPKGALTQEDIEILRVSTGQIVALLERATSANIAEPRFDPRARLDCAPLTFSQLAHWHMYRLSERHAIRQVAVATRLRGRLNIDALRRSVTEIVRRHDALRTRIVVCDGIPTQEIDESGDYELDVDELTALSERFHEVDVNHRIERLILEPIDVAVGPLFGLRLLKLREDEHVLIAAMEHIISDASSMNILLRDLFAAYAQASNGRDFLLPAIPMQFSDYAVWQRNAQKSWIEKHGAYLVERLRGCQRVKFPEDRSSATETHLGYGTVPLQIDRDLKTELCKWCRLRRTTLAMSVFTAYVGLVLRWCNASEFVIRYQSDGRGSPKIENTIGFFASALYLRIGLLEGDSFVDLLNRITEEYCKAYEGADFSYVAAQLPRPEFTRSTVFNWVPQGRRIGLSDIGGSKNQISCSPVHFTHPMLKQLELDQEPFVLLFDDDDEVVGDVYFPLNRFSVEMMERFGRNFLVFVDALLRQPLERVNAISLI